MVSSKNAEEIVEIFYMKQDETEVRFVLSVKGVKGDMNVLTKEQMEEIKFLLLPWLLQVLD